MKNKIKILLLILVVCLLASTGALAAGEYDINWWTIDNGGGTSISDSGQYELSGTIGQWDAGSTSGDQYAINSGFWGAVKSFFQEFLVYIPLVLK